MTRGLLLLTAHRAKGLEFDHVVLLDGGWGALSRNGDEGEDEDAPRRLFYVGMTRAQMTLAATMTGEHHFLKSGHDGLLRRKVNVAPDPGFITDRIYELPDLGTVVLSFAGYLGKNNPAHGAIASARVGDEIRLVQEGEGWHLQNLQGQPLGRMKRDWQPPPGHRLSQARVGAVVRWRKADSSEEYQGRLRRDEWETILPEFEFTGDGA